MACDHPMFGGERACKLDAGHRGRHSTVTYCCDACGKRRAGAPYRSESTYDDCFYFCLPCVKQSERDAVKNERDYWAAEKFDPTNPFG